jgi:hypothetical protein
VGKTLGRVNFEDREGDRKITLRCILGKWVMKMRSG